MWKRLAISDFEDTPEFPEDIQRIVRACAEYQYEISEETARRAWERYSESMAAGWMTLPEDNNTILSIILCHTYVV